MVSAPLAGSEPASEDPRLPAERRAAAKRPWELLSAMMTWAVFEKPSRKIAEGHTKNGGTAFVYRFDWRPTANARFEIGRAHV